MDVCYRMRLMPAVHLPSDSLLELLRFSCRDLLAISCPAQIRGCNSWTAGDPSFRPMSCTLSRQSRFLWPGSPRRPVSYTHLRAHETRHDLVCRLLLEKKKIQ